MMETSRTIDSALWGQFKVGSRLALSHIFDRHVGGLMSYGQLFTSDDRLVEDCIQDIFITLWERRNRLGDVISLKHYLCAALRRRLLRQLQTQRKRRGVPGGLNDPAMPTEASYETWLLQQQRSSEVQAILRRLIEQLTPQQQRVIYLKFYEHLSYEEIAALMKLNKRTVYNTCSAAIKHLQIYLSNAPRWQTLLSEATCWWAGLLILWWS